MSYGVQIFNNAGTEIVGGSQNVFLLDGLDVGGSGSKSYHLNPGEELVANAIVINKGAHVPQITGVSVSGNTVSWSVNGYGSVKTIILVTKKGTA
ncbi:MAG: hypothetical protein ACRC6V_02210 [Bacteroidales bacterium]